MANNRGVALILTLLVLSFLSILGGALLTTSTIDVWISDNYKAATQSLYLAEAGIDDARELLRNSDRSLTDWLNAPGPLIPSRPFGPGLYEVSLRNDLAERSSPLTDVNETVILTSVARVGTSQKTVEVMIQKGTFPETNVDPRLNSVAALEAFAGSVANNATEMYQDVTLGDVGSASNYRVIVVSGSADLGLGTGYGLLLVRGDTRVIGSSTWNGLIVLLGQGTMQVMPGGSLNVNGGLFRARTRSINGTLLSTPEDVTYDITDTVQIKAANRLFPYNPIAMKER